MTQATDGLQVASSFAPAKINLALHVTGRRDDGYHTLDSLVVFADVGDVVRVAPADTTSLNVVGPLAGGVPTDQGNLVRKAASWAKSPPVRIELEKHLPSAAGIGGGSSDAAACLRALSDLGLMQLPRAVDVAVLGADLPVCMHAKAARFEGIGEVVSPVADLPPIPMVLINPRVEIATKDVFAGLDRANNRAMPADLPTWADMRDLASWLAEQRNDLEPPALKVAPIIGAVKNALSATKGNLLARMSGSGATCFGIYRSRDEAEAASLIIASQHPDWWVVATTAR